ncbi:wound-induced basic protein-like [Solanum lycopersicum]|uniref:wound-induced basic protein-like n=1 Tax=Solanum lycopersicum TaxID=4081 RepID=UPI000532AAD0|nr:wound-induced basic protein-like [Solanum lycopersicum]
MIYEVNSPLLQSLLSQKGGASEKRTEEQKPNEHRPKASENKSLIRGDRFDNI